MHINVSDIFWFAGVGLWIAAVAKMPDNIPWWIRLFLLSFFCFIYAIQKTVWNIEKKVK